MKLARRWAGGGRHVVISADNSFHGRTLATLTATGQPEKHAPFLPLPEGFVHVSYDDVAALDAAMDADTVAATPVPAYRLMPPGSPAAGRRYGQVSVRILPSYDQVWSIASGL